MKIKVIDGKFCFYYKYDKNFIEICKDNGLKWDKGEKAWWTENIVCYKNCINDLRKKMGTETIDEDVSVKEKINKVSENIKESIKVNSDIIIKEKEGLNLYPFQRAGVEFLLNKKNVLLADEMGLGKTVQVINLLNNSSNLKVLIITPAALKLNWKYELEKWLIENKNIAVINGKFENYKDIIIINYDLLQKYKEELLKIDFNLIVCDEAHYLKNGKAKRTKLVSEIIDNNKEAKKVFLTGTPILNKPIEIFTILKMLDHPLGKNWFYYATRYCGAFKSKWGWITDKATNCEELQTQLRDNFMLRRLKKDVLTELPSKVRQLIILDKKDFISEVENEKKLFNEVEKLKIELKNIDKENKEEYKAKLKQLKDTSNINFIEISKIRHQIALKKVKYVKDFLEDYNDKIIIFAHHKDVVENLYNEFSDKSVKFIGDMNITERDEAIRKFQEDENIKFFFTTIQSGGVGITLTAASRVIFIELEWTPATIEQAEDRCHRIGQKETVIVEYFVVDETLDCKFAKTLADKKEKIDSILNEIGNIKEA